MNGPIAQIVELSCHANGILGDRQAKPFWPDSSSCAYCDSIQFVTLRRSLLLRQKEDLVATTPDEWFLRLQNTGARGVRLRRVPQNDPKISDRMSAGLVGGGGMWLMEVVLPENRSQFWNGRWTVWNDHAPDEKIWRVSYALISEEATPPFERINLQTIKGRLVGALSKIKMFSARKKCAGFTEMFQQALEILRNPKPQFAHLDKELGLQGLINDEAAILLDAAQAAWVFGGMDSWNDLSFDGADAQEYEQISENLFQILSEAIVAAANDSYRLKLG